MKPTPWKLNPPATRPAPKRLGRFIVDPEAEAARQIARAAVPTCPDPSRVIGVGAVRFNGVASPIVTVRTSGFDEEHAVREAFKTWARGAGVDCVFAWDEEQPEEATDEE